MSLEIAKLRERLKTNEKLLQAIAIGIETDIDEMRSKADKYEDKASIDCDRICLLADRVRSQVRRYRELTEMNKNIREDLGE